MKIIRYINIIIRWSYGLNGCLFQLVFDLFFPFANKQLLKIIERSMEESDQSKTSN
jgi:hypothetical protein